MPRPWRIVWHITKVPIFITVILVNGRKGALKIALLSTVPMQNVVAVGLAKYAADNFYGAVITKSLTCVEFGYIICRVIRA